MELALDHTGPEGLPFRVPDECLLGPYRPHQVAPRPFDDTISAALDQPVDVAPLRQRAEDAEHVLLLVDDATRKTPVARILPHVMAHLGRGGIRDEQVTVLVATGTHRPMRPDELAAKLGSFAERLEVVQHDGRATADLVHLGQTIEGMPIVANRLLTTHDLVLGIGSVGIHGIMGYSGGAKIAAIGAAGHATEAWTHWRAATRYQTADLMGRSDNPLRRNLDEAGRVADLDAVLNVVLDADGSVVKAAYGGPAAAQRALIPPVRKVAAVEVPRQADIVIVDAAPADRDYWQSIKGLYAADLLVREGGAIVLVAPNPEGVAANHPNVVELAGLPFDEIVARHAAQEVPDVIGAAIAAYTARTRRHARLYMVTRGIRPRTVRALGFEPALDVQDALDAASGGVGPHPQVAVLMRGGMLLPVLPGAPRHATTTPPIVST